MKKVKIKKSWTALGYASCRTRERERAKKFPIHVNSYGFVDPIDVFGWLFGVDDSYLYFSLRHALYSRRIAQLKAAERRPKYYEVENERRRALAAARRKIRSRSTINACPTREEILEAWKHRRDSHEHAIRFGSLLEDLECYLDNSLKRNENGVIIGRNSGIKGWLFENLPDVFEMYSTAMRYKAAAKKLKQVSDLADPMPVDVVLPQDIKKCDYGADEKVDDDEKGLFRDKDGCEGQGEIARPGGIERIKGRDGGNVAEAVPELAIVRARAIWLEIVEGIGKSATALMRRLDALTDPKCVEDANMLAAWREKYLNEITERTKKSWWRRIVRVVRKKRQDSIRKK